MEIDNTLGNNPNIQIVNPDNQNIPPKQKRYILPILGLIFLIVIVGVGAYYLWTKNNQNKEVPLSAVQQEMFRSAGVTIETADWKTYTGLTSQLNNGPQGRFSIKYPSTWESVGSILYPLKENKQTSIELGAGPMGGPFNSVKKTFPAGVSNYVWVKEPSDDKIFGRATFLQGNVSYSFNFLNLPIQYDKEYQKIFDLMLSTFKVTFEVIDQNQTTDISNWKTYTNTKHNFTFKYPSTWTIRGAPIDRDKDLAQSDYGVDLSSPCNYDSGDFCSSFSCTIHGFEQNGKFDPIFIINQNNGDVILSKKMVKFSGTDALEEIYFQGNYGNGVGIENGRLQYVLVIEHNPIKIVVTYEEQNNNLIMKTPDQWKNKDTLGNILSTFKFLD